MDRIEVKQRADGDWQWDAWDRGNNRHLYGTGEGFQNRDYAVKSARDAKPDLAVVILDEQGGIIEEFRPVAHQVVPGREHFEQGSTITIEGTPYVVLYIGLPDAQSGNFTMEVVDAASYAAGTNVTPPPAAPSTFATDDGTTL